MYEDIDRYPSNWIERIQHPEGIGRTESKNVFAFTNDDECLKQIYYDNL